MKISDNTNVRYGQIPGRYEVIPQKDTGNILTKAIKDYKDEYLTGLTDEERAKIDEEIKAYLEQHELKTEQDRNKLNSFIKRLLKKYGFKGDYEDFIGEIDEDEATPLKSDTAFAYEKSICSGVASKVRLLEMEQYPKSLLTRMAQAHF
ncbi:MAG TPA: hypothetical protein GX707_04450 [Epulopiscium sp.]|nr:hypothetical protein [Candidatus Epulonipiscium sp.]